MSKDLIGLVEEIEQIWVDARNRNNMGNEKLYKIKGAITPEQLMEWIKSNIKEDIAKDIEQDYKLRGVHAFQDSVYCYFDPYHGVLEIF